MADLFRFLESQFEASKQLRWLSICRWMVRLFLGAVIIIFTKDLMPIPTAIVLLLLALIEAVFNVIERSIQHDAVSTRR